MEVEIIFKKCETYPADFDLRKQLKKVQKMFPQFKVIKSSSVLLAYKKISRVSEGYKILKYVNSNLEYINNELFLNVSSQIREENGDIIVF